MSFHCTRWARAAVAMLCIALSLVFAGAAAANVVDRVQHGAQGNQAHQHSVLSDISFNVDHDHDHVDASGDQADPIDGGAAHHHHGEGPSGYVAQAGLTPPLPRLALAHLAPAPSNLPPGALPGGLERPPRLNGSLV